jgi:hypothetical protein
MFDLYNLLSRHPSTHVIAIVLFQSDSDRFLKHTHAQNDQRQMRKDETAGGTEWSLKRFAHVEEDVEYQQLVEMLHDKYQPAHEDGYVFRG